MSSIENYTIILYILPIFGISFYIITCVSFIIFINKINSIMYNNNTTNTNETIIDLENNNCIICYDNIINIILFPCKHKYICDICLFQLVRNNMYKCPICRNIIYQYEYCNL